MNSSGGLSAALHAERLAKLGRAAALGQDRGPDPVARALTKPLTQDRRAVHPRAPETRSGTQARRAKPRLSEAASATAACTASCSCRSSRTPAPQAFLGTIRGRRLSTDPSLYGSVQPRITVVCLASNLRVFGGIGMEQLWNRGGATGGKGSGRKKPKMA